MNISPSKLMGETNLNQQRNSTWNTNSTLWTLKLNYSKAKGEGSRMEKLAQWWKGRRQNYGWLWTMGWRWNKDGGSANLMVYLSLWLPHDRLREGARSSVRRITIDLSATRHKWSSFRSIRSKSVIDHIVSCLSTMRCPVDLTTKANPCLWIEEHKQE